MGPKVVGLVSCIFSRCRDYKSSLIILKITRVIVCVVLSSFIDLILKLNKIQLLINIYEIFVTYFIIKFFFFRIVQSYFVKWVQRTFSRLNALQIKSNIYANLKKQNKGKIVKHIWQLNMHIQNHVQELFYFSWYTPTVSHWYVIIGRDSMTKLSK